MFFVLLLMLLVTAPSTVHAQNARQFTLGIVRADAVVIPIAMYDRGKWFNSWPPESSPPNDSMANLSDIPVSWYPFQRPIPQTWDVRVFAGTQMKVKILRPILAKHERGAHWGLLSSFPLQNVDSNFCCPFSKVGLASDSEIDFKPVNTVQVDSIHGPSLRSLVQATFDQLERSSIDLLRRDRITPAYDSILTAVVKSKLEVSFSKLYSVDVDSSNTVYYFEARKEYPVAQDYQQTGFCNTISFFQGWVCHNRNSNSFSYLEKHFELTDCDMKTASLLELYFTGLVDGRTVAVGVTTGWDSEQYVVIEITRSQVIELVRTFIDAP
jgi:hypothetical protein